MTLANNRMTIKRRIQLHTVLIVRTPFFRFLSDEGCGRKYLSAQRGLHTQSIVYYIRLLCCKIGDDEKNRKNHDFIFPKVKNDGRIVGRKTYGKVLIILRICNKGGTILDFSDVLIIIIVILALLCVWGCII